MMNKEWKVRIFLNFYVIGRVFGLLESEDFLFKKPSNSFEVTWSNQFEQSSITTWNGEQILACRKHLKRSGKSLRAFPYRPPSDPWATLGKQNIVKSILQLCKFSNDTPGFRSVEDWPFSCTLLPTKLEYFLMMSLWRKVNYQNKCDLILSRSLAFTWLCSRHWILSSSVSSGSPLWCLPHSLWIPE